MQPEKYKRARKSNGLFYRAGTRIYFKKDTERRFFFVLTIIMLVCGILYKAGLF